MKNEFLEAVLVHGKSVPVLSKETIELFNKPKRLCVGDEEKGTTLEEITQKLSGKINFKTKIVIHAEVIIKEDSQTHSLKLSDEEDNVATELLFAILRQASASELQVYLLSRYCGNAVNAILKLKKESVYIFAKGIGSENLVAHDNSIISSLIENNANKYNFTPYHYFLRNIAKYAMSNGIFITHKKVFFMKARCEVLLDRNYGSKYLEKEVNRFIEFAKTNTWNSKSIELEKEDFTEQDIDDFVAGFFVHSCFLGEKAFIKFFKKNIKQNAYLQNLVNNSYHGYTSMHAATSGNHQELVKILISAGADVNKADKYGQTPLYEASIDGNIKLIKLLLKAGANVNKANINGKTPLHLAAQSGFIKIVRLLLNARADITKTTKDGKTPLSLATDSKSLEIVRLLNRALIKLDQ